MADEMREILKELVDTIKGSHVSNGDWIKNEIDQALKQIQDYYRSLVPEGKKQDWQGRDYDTAHTAGFNVCREAILKRMESK
jgi:hypothetical protein